MAISIYGHGYPLSAVSHIPSGYTGKTSATQLDIYWCGATQVAQISGSHVAIPSLSATLVQGTTICGATAASAVNLVCTYTGGSSATISAGTPQAISADRFLKITINSKTFYIPAFASAGTCSAA